jgi:hypothetical protein
MTHPANPALHGALATLLAELVDGAEARFCWVLNHKDPGLLRSLDRLSAADASAVAPGGGASIAAHTDHLRYGLSLMNRWSAGDPDPWADADWTASWRRLTVSDPEWGTLRRELGEQVHQWLGVLRQPRTLNEMELTGLVASVVHLAYHLGAVRQINRAMRGPSAEEG